MHVRLPLVALGLGLVLSASKCSESGLSNPAEVLDTKWMLKTLGGEAVTMPEGMSAPWLQLAADNAVSGFAGCNNLTGQYKLEGNTIGFPGLATTKKFCEPTQKVEDAFLGALREANSVKLDKGMLKLLQGDKELAAFSKE